MNYGATPGGNYGATPGGGYNFGGATPGNGVTPGTYGNSTAVLLSDTGVAFTGGFSMPPGIEDDGAGAGLSLADDPALMVSIAQEELDVIDNELFEPLNTLDAELREICIDVVNEKVRRILSVDPSKFKGGKLPFGLRPDKLDADAYQKVLQL